MNEGQQLMLGEDRPDVSDAELSRRLSMQENGDVACVEK